MRKEGKNAIAHKDLVRRLSCYVEKNGNFEGRLEFIMITIFKINLSINVGLVVAFLVK